MTQETLRVIAQKLYNKKFPNTPDNLKFISDIKLECKPRFSFLYFETEIFSKEIKRYHMVAIDSLMTDVLWYETNVVLFDGGYADGTSKAINNFRRDLLYWLLNLDLPSKSVSEDTIDNLQNLCK